MKSSYHWLIESGAAIDTYDEFGMTPLLYAVFIGHSNAVELLLKSGANPNLPSRDGMTPLWHAAEDFGLEEVAAILRCYSAINQVEMHARRLMFTIKCYHLNWQVRQSLRDLELLANVHEIEVIRNRVEFLPLSSI